MIDNILNPVIVAMLKDLEVIFRKHGVDFYLVGAIARDIHLASKPEYGAVRGTKDVDIAILLANEEQFYQVKASLLTVGSFEAHPQEAIRLIYQKSIELDLLPFGAIENEQRETKINKPKAFAINVPGFGEAYSSVAPISIGGMTINVCSLEGIVLLKLIANDDRATRTKDLSDIEHIINVYFDLFDDEIYSECFDAMSLYDEKVNNYLQLVSAWVIGRKMKRMLAKSPEVLQRIETILRNRPIDTWQAMLEGVQYQ